MKLKLRFGVSGSKIRLGTSHRNVREEAEQFFAGGKPKVKKSKMERKRLRRKAEQMKIMDHSDDRVKR